MKCVFYEFKTSSHCTECDVQEVCQPEVFVNKLLEDVNVPHNGWEFVNKRAFSVFSQGDQYNTVLKFKYAPPKISELLDRPTVKPTSQPKFKQSQSLQEFCPEYSSEPGWSSHLSNQNFQPQASLNNSSGSPNVDNCSLNSNFHKKEIVSSKKDRGSWCVYSVPSARSSKQNNPNSIIESPIETCCVKIAKQSVCSTLSKRVEISPSAWKQQNGKYDLQSLKKKYNISNYHRGKWLITSKEENISSLWREVCKLISSRELVHCNAKYQIHEILKHKMNIEQVLSYCIYPHGVVMKM